MSTYLSTEWMTDPVDATAIAASAAGLQVRIGRVVSKAPDGEVRYTAAVSPEGVEYLDGLDDDVDISFTDTYANALAQLRGELDPNAAFMRGQTKVTGPTSVILSVLAATKTEAYEQARAEAAGRAGV